MNKVIIAGRLTADPELRQTRGGVSSCRFTVAVNRRYRDSQTGETTADFISCTAWRQTAEFIARYFKKGSMLVLEGTLRTGSYQDKNHPDVTHYTTDVIAENVEFCGGKKDDSSAASELIADARSAGIPAVQGDFSGYEMLADGDAPF